MTNTNKDKLDLYFDWWCIRDWGRCLPTRGCDRGVKVQKASIWTRRTMRSREKISQSQRGFLILIMLRAIPIKSISKVCLTREKTSQCQRGFLTRECTVLVDVVGVVSHVQGEGWTEPRNLVRAFSSFQPPRCWE